MWEQNHSSNNKRWPAGYQLRGELALSNGKPWAEDKGVKEEPRFFDLERREPVGRSQMGNNGSQRPYIRPQSDGSWIQSVYQSQRARSTSIKWTTKSQVVGSCTVGSPQGVRSLRRDVRGWDIRNLRIEIQILAYYLSENEQCLEWKSRLPI